MRLKLLASALVLLLVPGAAPPVANAVATFQAPTPSMVGYPQVGYGVSVKIGSWNPQPTTTRVTWAKVCADGKAVYLATASSYLAKETDRGCRLRVTVRGERAGYATVSRTSTLSKPVLHTAIGAANLAGATRTQVRADATYAITRRGAVTPVPAEARADGGQHLKDGCAAAIADSTPDFTCLYGDPSAPVKVALVGDSHAADWFEPLRRIGAVNDWSLLTLTKSGCSLTTAGEPADCLTYNTRLVDGLVARDVSYVFVSTAAVEQVNADGAVPLWRRLQADGMTIIVLHDTPYPAFNVPACLVANPTDYMKCSFRRNPGNGTAGLLSTAAQVPGAVVVDMNDWLCPLGDTCAPVVSKILVWRDHSHLTASYAASLAPALSHQLYRRGLLSKPLYMVAHP